MNFSVLFSLFLKYSSFGEYDDESVTSLAEFVVEISTNYYARNYPTVNFIYALENKKNFELGDLQNAIVKDVFNGAEIAIRVESADKLKSVKFRPKTCMVIFIDTFNSFLKVLERMTTSIFKFHGYYAIVLTNGKINSTDEIFKRLWEKQIYNVVILFADGLAVKALTFYPFNEKKCNDTATVELDISTTGVENLFVEKLKNLNKCPMTVSAPEVEPFVMKNKNNEFVGRDIDLVKSLAKALNFQLKLDTSGLPLTFGMKLANGSFTGSMKDLLNFDADIAIGDCFLKPSRLIYLDASSSYYNSRIIFVVPPGRKLRSIEKLLQPFSTTVWIILAAFVLITFATIYLLKLKSKNFARNMFKRRSPYLSLVSIIFGISLPSFPRKSSFRIVWVSFVMFFLVWQAVYQGSLYKYLQIDSQLKEVQSIEEMIEKDFKFYSIGSLDDVFEGHEKIKRRFVYSLRLKVFAHFKTFLGKLKLIPKVTIR